MTDKEALDLLDQATQPENVGKINRKGYWQIEEALNQLRKSLKDDARDNGGKEAVQ